MTICCSLISLPIYVASSSILLYSAFLLALGSPSLPRLQWWECCFSHCQRVVTARWKGPFFTFLKFCSPRDVYSTFLFFLIFHLTERQRLGHLGSVQFNFVYTINCYYNKGSTELLISLIFLDYECDIWLSLTFCAHFEIIPLDCIYRSSHCLLLIFSYMILFSLIVHPFPFNLCAHWIVTWTHTLILIAYLESFLI